jgi:hypothetical protein
MLLDPSRLQLPSLLPPAAVEPLAVSVLCTTLALAFVLATGWSRRAVTLGTPASWRVRLADQSGSVEIGATMSSVFLLLLLLGPVSISPAVRVQTDAEVGYLYEVAADLPPFQWTVVTSPESLPQVLGRGFFVDRQQFVTAYDPRAWRFDPRRPELSIPTPYVVVVVADSTPAADREAILSWMARYSSAHPDSPPTVSVPRDGLVVYQLHRSPEEEARIVEEARLAGYTGPVTR